MEIIDFSKLYELDFNLKNLFAVKQYWKEKSYFKMSNPRKTSCLLLLCGCSAKYKFAAGELMVPRHSVIYIPEGAVYESHFFDCENSVPATILIEFGLYLPDGSSFCAAKAPTLLKNEVGLIISELFNDAADMYSQSVISRSKIKSIIYNLIYEFSYSERQKSIYSRGFNTIAKGIAILESDFKSEITIKELAKICHVSESTFRRLFREYKGKSPAEYRIERRISYAKKLLKTGGMTVIEVALEAGFDDPAYFCRVFKKQTGITAGEYLKKK
ncbi:MAG: helix-turn-helix transcriptional regulator [Clostridia bacterium]|nr:helix-turn-helix transcriptional regulator [Clostridia bacterium]